MEDNYYKYLNYFLKLNSIIIINIFIFISILLKNNQIKNTKVCLCTNGKKENLYVREYVEHYKKYGVDKIFIYDNNEVDGEKFEDVILDYINNEFVEIINYRGLLSPQENAYKDCQKKNFKIFNWLIFFDMDEYIYLKNYNNIKYFLNRNRFNKCQRIQLNWIFHTDNNLIYYDNRTLSKRFPERELRARGKKKGGIQGIKSILRGNIEIDIKDVHILNKTLISCDGFGNIKEVQNIITNVSDFYYYYIDHYYSKSTEEFIKKLMRGSAVHGFDITHKLKRIDVYFSINEITLNKINYIENQTKLNLSKFRKKLKTFKN